MIFASFPSGTVFPLPPSPPRCTYIGKLPTRKSSITHLASHSASGLQNFPRYFTSPLIAASGVQKRSSFLENFGIHEFTFRRSIFQKRSSFWKTSEYMNLFSKKKFILENFGIHEFTFRGGARISCSRFICLLLISNKQINNKYAGRLGIVVVEDDDEGLLIYCSFLILPLLLLRSLPVLVHR